MAKKRVDIVIDESNIQEMIDSGSLIITTLEDTVQAKVKHFRSIGFDNNRIASLLGIQKSVVDGIV